MSIHDHGAAAGDVLGERYSLRRIEWVGRLGAVWLARDQVLDRPVFVQLLTPELAGHSAVRRSFQKAAARVAQVSHPGVLQVYDIGDEPVFAVFEHAGGGRLSDRLRAGAMSPTDAARAALAVARGLEAMHEHGVTHGTLGPHTVLLDEEGRAKLLAVGAVATEQMDGVDADVEQPPGYLPPEPDAPPEAADRYALAALTYQMLSGAPPGRGALPRRAQALTPLLDRALSPIPARRPPLAEFVAALAPFARYRPPDVKEARFAGSEFRWLAAVVVIIALAAVAATLGVSLVRDLARRNPAGPPASPAPGATTGFSVAAVTDFDPPPGDNDEHGEDVGRAIDDDPLSVWETEGYTRENFGAKDGVGLLFDMGEVVDLRRIRVQSTRPGWTAEIRVADEEGRTPDDFRLVTNFTAGSDTAVAIPAAARGRYWLLWITRLVDDGSGSDLPFRAAVAEITFLGV